MMQASMCHKTYISTYGHIIVISGRGSKERKKTHNLLSPCKENVHVAQEGGTSAFSVLTWRKQKIKCQVGKS